MLRIPSYIGRSGTLLVLFVAFVFGVVVVVVVVVAAAAAVASSVFLELRLVREVLHSLLVAIFCSPFSMRVEMHVVLLPSSVPCSCNVGLALGVGWGAPVCAGG